MTVSTQNIYPLLTIQTVPNKRNNAVLSLKVRKITFVSYILFCHDVSARNSDECQTFLMI